MRDCYQTSSQNVLEHGLAVNQKYLEMHAYLTCGAPLQGDWRVPLWFSAESLGPLIATLPSANVMRAYQVYHDCGKPKCRTLDEEGRQHFPNHAVVSQQVWREHGGDDAVGELIGHDMDMHMLKADDLPTFAKSPYAFALLLTSIAEIHANAALFGGTDSTSFKMKAKHLDRRGKKLVEMLLDRNAI